MPTREPALQACRPAAAEATLPRSVCGPARWLWVAALVSALAGCGGGGGAAADTAPLEPILLTASHQPLGAGDQWLYRDQAGALERVKVAGSRTVGADLATVVLSKALGADDSSATESLVVKSETALRELSATDPNALVRAVGDFVNLRFAQRRGSSFVQADRTDSSVDVDGDGVPDRLTVKSTGEVLGTESISTEAGVFADAVHLRSTATIELQSSLAQRKLVINSTADEWYVSEVGLVLDRIRTVADGDVSNTSRQLVAYTVGSRRSESVAPVMSSSSLVSGVTLGLNDTAFELGFSEAIDPDTAMAAVRVLDSAGQPQATQIFVSGVRVVVQTMGPLPTGAYRLALSAGLRDLAGNGLAAPLTIPFNKDVTPPGISRITPADGARYVPLNTVVEIELDEDVDAAQMTAQYFSLSTLVSQPVTVEMVNSRTVRLRPQAPLQPAQTYTVQVTSLSDRYGNSRYLVASTTFTTDPGVLDYARDLFAEEPRNALTTADITGGGRAAVIFQRPPGAADAGGMFRLEVWAMANDGQMQLLQAIPAPRSQAGTALAITTADLNGDGRRDVVVVEDQVGVVIYLQNSQGQLERGRVLASAFVAAVEVADLDGDGRPDLVTRHYDDPRVLRLWRQQPDGSFGAPEVITTSAYIDDLRVVDINGDKRPDLVWLAGVNDSAVQSWVFVSLQRADGSFASPLQLPFAASIGSAGLAVGDLNGDGRPDLWVSNAFAQQRLYLQQADGSFAAQPDPDLRFAATRATIADIDGDGRKDLVLSGGGSGEVGLLRQRADGSLGPLERFRGPCPATLGDLDGDGRPDVVSACAQVLLNRAQAVGSGAVGRAWPTRAQRVTGALR